MLVIVRHQNEQFSCAIGYFVEAKKEEERNQGSSFLDILDQLMEVWKMVESAADEGDIDFG